MIKGLALKEGDEIEFFQNGNQYIVAKKSDLLNLITGKAQVQQPQATKGPELSMEEIAVLRKLDAIRYSDRTKERLKQALNGEEKKVLVGLIKKKYVEPFKKAGEQVAKYGISKGIYNKFIYGRREIRQQAAAPMQQQQQTVTVQRTEPKKWEKSLTDSSYLNLLEANGYLVVSNQAEATAISMELEESIRRGLVVGTRAFNKRYYITLKSFVTKNAARVMKSIGVKGTPIAEISRETGIDEEGIRAILYMLAENGDVAESRRDFFRLV